MGQFDPFMTRLKVPYLIGPLHLAKGQWLFSDAFFNIFQARKNLIPFFLYSHA